MNTSVSEFVRQRPRETYKQINELLEELESMQDFGKNQVDTKYMKTKVQEIRRVFLLGE